MPILSATGSTAMGREVGPKLASALRPRDPRTRRQQRRHRRARRPISISRCAASPSPPWARPASAARPCAACSCMTASTTSSCRGCRRSTAASRIGDPRADGTLVGPLIDKAAFEGMQRALDEARAAGGTVHGGGRDADGACAEGLLRPSGPGRDADADRPGAARDLRADPLRDALLRLRRGDRRATTRCGAGPVVVDLHHRPARGRARSSRRAAPTAASPTSISAHPAPRSAARSAARRKPAAAARPAPMPGRPICAAPPTRSITARRCRWPRA